MVGCCYDFFSCDFPHANNRHEACITAATVESSAIGLILLSQIPTPAHLNSWFLFFLALNQAYRSTCIIESVLNETYMENGIVIGHINPNIAIARGCCLSMTAVASYSFGLHAIAAASSIAGMDNCCIYVCSPRTVANGQQPVVSLPPAFLNQTIVAMPPTTTSTTQTPQGQRIERLPSALTAISKVIDEDSDTEDEDSERAAFIRKQKTR